MRNRRVWLGVLLVWLCLYHGLITYSVIDDGLHGQSKPGLPLYFGFRMQVISGLTNEANEAGVRFLDVLETVDGQPFSNLRVFHEAVNSRKPGDFLPVTVRSARGTQFAASIRIPPDETEPPTILEWLIQMALTLGLPLFSLSLGFWVAFQRPNDRLAWLLLVIMIGCAGLGQEFPVERFPGQLLMCAWWVLFASVYGLWMAGMLLFAFLFPTPSRFDRRAPWIKWLLTVPVLLNALGMTIFEVGRQVSFQAIAFLRPFLQLERKLRPDLLLPIGVIALFILLIGIKSFTSETLDGRRRLRILLLGGIVSFTPVVLQSVRSLLKGADLLGDLTPLEDLAILLPMLLFPLTLTYVIVIRRAMDVPSTLRQAIQYALARRGLPVLQMIATAGVIGVISVLSADRDRSFAVQLWTIAAGLAALLLLRPGAQGLALWIDRHFFREAYNNEQSLSDLALSLRTLMEENTLIQTLTQKISAALHVPRITFLLNDAGQFAPAYSTTAANTPIILAESSGVVRHLKLSQKTAPIYFDDPKDWIQSIHPADQESLKTSQTEVIIPVAVKDKLLGVLALGAKQSEAPYTGRELQLLDAVAIQAGFALENSRLTSQVAQEIARREKLSREMEIARDVQERLLPQSLPPMQGVDYFGTCRPALACGGDYYDFLALPGKILCFAIGDVSGKGIAAALLMASLQASLRGQALEVGQDLAGQIGVVNRGIDDASAVNRYAALFYAQFHLPTRELEYVNAGHTPPMVLRKHADGRSEVIRLETGGPVVGLLPEAHYLQGKVQLQPNDLFVGFTDGVSEARNSADEEWGEERMIAVLERCEAGDAAGLARAVIAEADAFMNGAAQHDDMTVFIMRVLAG